MSVFILPSSYSRKCHRMQDTASMPLHFATIFGFSCSFCLQTGLLAISTPGNGRQSHFPAMCRRRNTCNRKPCTHDNGGYRTSVMATGKLSFPFLLLHLPLSISVARCAMPSVPFSFSPLHVYASVPMPSSRLHQHVIFVAGAKVIPG